jgi:two-component system sensor histidine kinase/response regulator
LRAPLTAVGGMLQLGRMNPNPTTEDLRRFMSRAEVGISTLTEMISSLLDVNRFEAGEMPLRRELCDLKDVGAAAAKSLEGLLLGRDFRVDAPTSSVHAFCDPEIVRRVLVNLIGNAVKFTPSTGSVCLALKNENGRARAEIRDTGYGIAPEYLNRIFEKFGQVEARKEQAVYSTGLGLTFCKLAVEAHQGAIGVSSELGSGSTFWFELPTSI